MPVFVNEMREYDMHCLVSMTRCFLQVAVEFPAGLIDAGDSTEACAVRELREETGLTGKV